MSDADPYPDVPEDAEGGDALVRILSEMDEDHFTKATALVGLAQTEWVHSIEYDDGYDEFDDVSFEEFIEIALEQYEEVGLR